MAVGHIVPVPQGGLKPGKTLKKKLAVLPAVNKRFIFFDCFEVSAFN